MRSIYNTFRATGAAIIFFVSCSTPKQVQVMENTPVIITPSTPVDSVKTYGLIEMILKQYPADFSAVLSNSELMNVQVIYTQIDRGANGVPSFTDHFFNVNPARYFYPASTVKLPVVLLALEKLRSLSAMGVDMNSTMITGAAYSGQTAVLNDPTTPDGRPTIANYIRKILLVSDNDAYNRLYEFLGQEYINDELHKKGYADAQLLHRLQIFLSEDENRHTNPVSFFDSANRKLYDQPMQFNRKAYVKRSDSLGKGYMSSGSLVNGAMDFSKKNRISLEDLHNIVKGIVFPSKQPVSQRFDITEADRMFVLKHMSQFPDESRQPPYADDTATYWPAYAKLLFYGGAKGPVDRNIRIFNKEGDAYGHLVDVAYIVDHSKKIEFLLSAVIYCNKDGILNDDRYDYAEVGKPFMKRLGEVIYAHELKRERKRRPDLSGLVFDYDK